MVIGRDYSVFSEIYLLYFIELFVVIGRGSNNSQIFERFFFWIIRPVMHISQKSPILFDIGVRVFVVIVEGRSF